MATTFSSSPSGLSLSPFTSSGRTTNAAAYGNAVDLGKIYGASRNNAFDPSAFIAQDMASTALGQSAVMEDEGDAYLSSLGAINYVNQKKNEAQEIKKAAAKKAKGGIFGSGLGAVVGIGATLATGNPMIGMAAGNFAKSAGTAAVS